MNSNVTSPAGAPQPTPETLDVIGSWRLVGCSMSRNGECVQPYFMGREPVGFIHYLPDGRMAFVSRAGESVGDSELVSGAGRPVAYAAPYTREGGTLIHHVEVSTTAEHVGTDFIRHIGIDGPYMTLNAPPRQHEDGPLVLTLTWERIDGRPLSAMSGTAA
jgi:hypothetical protein